MLYLVSTPIGNLGDFSIRALDILKQVDYLLREDTRVTRVLCSKYGIQTRLVGFNQHTESQKIDQILDDLKNSISIGLVSDAGTPIVSDPGARLVAAVHEMGLSVTAIPGPSAVLTAWSVSGFLTNTFQFIGFLPRKKSERLQYLTGLVRQESGLIFFESPHRIVSTLQDLVSVFGETREAVFCRELTKTFETIRRDSLSNLTAWVSADTNQQRGEIVIVVDQCRAVQNQLSDNLGLKTEYPIPLEQLIAVLSETMSAAQVSKRVSDLTGIPKNQIYRLILE